MSSQVNVFSRSHQDGSVAVNHPFRLDLRFLSAILNRQVKVIGFCGFCLSLTLLNDDLPNFLVCWLFVRSMVDA